MSEYILAVNPGVIPPGTHDPAAALFTDGSIVFGIEEERLSRDKHAVYTFPEQAVRACLAHRGLDLSDVTEVRIPWQPRATGKLRNGVRIARKKPSVREAVSVLTSTAREFISGVENVDNALSRIGTPVPPIKTFNHHRCHAVSAFNPSGFEEALVITIDGAGDYASTVVWHGTPDGVERIRTYFDPNSWGKFYAAVTKYLGFYPLNGEGKVMGLAPYGSLNEIIESTLRDAVSTGVEYDVTSITGPGGFEGAVRRLEALFDRPRRRDHSEFTDWERDLAYVSQTLLEETVTDIVSTYSQQIGVSDVCMAGGVALNCKLNQCVREIDSVDDVFVQPVANDAGASVGAGLLATRPSMADRLSDVYLGPSFSTEAVLECLEEKGIAWREPADVIALVANRLACGEVVGWFQGRTEFGPRALGNRSILADPRFEDTRDRINDAVKDRERWRPFAPSMIESVAPDYLRDATAAPFMIMTFDASDQGKEALPAALHPADNTVRPQTVRRDVNPRYYLLLEAFAERTSVPALLNTSFNMRGQPIVNTPEEAIDTFLAMNLDILVLEDIIVDADDVDQSIHDS